MIVADSNLIASCVLESAATESALALWREDPDWRVPRLWRYEVMNILSTMVKAKRLDKKSATALYTGLAAALEAGERDSPAKAVMRFFSVLVPLSSI